MDGDGSGFPFPSASDFSRGQDATDISWGDMFLDGIHSDDTSTSEAGGINSDTTSIASIHGTAPQMLHQSHPNVVGGQVQIHIPTHLQGSLTNNAVQQTSTSLCGTVAYLAPSASSHQHVSTAGRIQNVMTSGGQHQVTAAVSQQHQGNAKLVQIAPSFPIASLTNSVPLQTFLQSNQTLAGQTIYGSQSTGLFPAQGSVHIENPKVVNVNFGPHVIGSDGSGQQAIIQTAEGKRVLITNSQLQHMSQCLVPQSISLTQPLVGTQLLNPAGGNVIRASMAQGTHTIVPSSSTATRQIVLPQGQTVIPRQTTTPQAGLPKNVVLRQLNSNMSPVIYQSGQGGQLIQSQPTLIASSGQGLQVVNAAGSQGGQVQLIAQPTINQAGMGQQQLNQNTIMNLINNQNVIPNAGNQITGLVPGQNILVNGQMLNIGQLSGLTMSQLPMQANSQGSVTLANLNTSVTRPAQFQPTTQQLVIQQNGQSQQIMLQPKNTLSPANMTNTVPSQRLSSALPGGKIARTPTPNANSASSTPVPTPTPSTPTPTPTPDLISDFCGSGGKSGQSINILEQALEMSDIDLQSFEDDFNFLDNPSDNFSSVTTPPLSITPVLLPKTKPQPAKIKSKSSKPKSKISQPTVNVTVNNSTVPFQLPTAQLQNTQGQKVTISPQQKIIAANGQVYVLSPNCQQIILQPSATTASPIAPQLKPIASQAPAVINTSKTNISIPSNAQLQLKGISQQSFNQSNIVSGQVKISPQNIPISAQQKNVLIAANSQTDSKVLIKTGPEGNQAFKIETASQAVTAAQVVFATTAALSTSPTAPLSQTSAVINQAQILQVKNQKITTLGGTFIKQEPVSSVIKQEPVTELQASVPLSHSSATVSATVNFPLSTLAVTTSNLVTMTTPLVVSLSSHTAVTTTTTQSHQPTIMSTAQMAGPQQTFVSSAGASLPHSSAFNESTSMGGISANLLQSTPSITMTVTSPSATATSTTSSTNSKSSSKEKDPANVKSMTPIKIANTTLMLSLTPGQKERLENQLSRMSMKDQNEFLAHQQNIIRRSQQVQQKQLEQQQKYQLQQKQKQLQQLQQQQHLQPQEVQQTEIVQQAQQQLKQLQQQSGPMQAQLPTQTSQANSQTQASALAAKISFHSHALSGSDSHASTGLNLPTTIQELIEKPEEGEVQGNFQPLSSMKSSEHQQHQSQIPHQSSSLQQNQLSSLQQQQQQQSVQSITQRSSSHTHKVPSVQQFIIPQTGRCLAEQQLLRDCSLALGPDVNSRFKNLSDAMRRLVRYHTLQDHKPDEDDKATSAWEFRYTKLCEYLVKKKRYYMRRFNKMKLYNDMCGEKRIENLQNILCFNEQLREVIDREKEEAKNSPDTFEPMKPESQIKQETNHSPISSYYTGKDEISVKKELEVDEVLEEVDLEEDYEEKETVLEPVCAPERPDSPYASPSNRKRKIPDQGSTGTLKLVFKRRTTDNFVVKNSSTKRESLPQDLKPVVNLEKSDSEYEYDSQSAIVSDKQPVIVRRRTLSVSSQQASLETGSRSASPTSEKVVDSSDEEEDEDSREAEDDEDADEEDNEEEEKFTSEEEDSCDEGDRSVETKDSKSEFRVSFEDGEENDANDTNDDACSVNADAFMETDDMTSESDISQLYKMSSASCTSRPTLSYTEANSTDVKTHKKSRQLSQRSAITSDEMFNSNLNSNLSFPQGDSSLTNDPSDSEDTCNAGNRTNHHAFSFDSNVNDAQHPFSRSSIASSPTQDEEYVAESPVSNMEKEAARKGLPSSSLFTTPNKSLLQTDAMFNTSSEDEDNDTGGTRLVSAFEIDNKDPQSSMINDSVRSAINSVLNDNDDDNDDSQASWSSAPHRHLSSSSSRHHNLFQASSSIPPSHDADLDAAVQSILNSS